MGAAVCTNVLHFDCICLLASQGPDQCTQAVWYRSRPTNKGPDSKKSDQPEVCGGWFSRETTISNFPQNTQNCFAYSSATKYRSEAVLYSKRTAGYPLSPHIKSITVAFLQAE